MNGQLLNPQLNLDENISILFTDEPIIPASLVSKRLERKVNRHKL